MTDKKFDKACRLYLAISELDDKTATDALRFRQTTSRGLRVALIMAACLVLVISTTLMAAVIANIKSENSDVADSPNTAPPQNESEALSSILKDYRENVDSSDASSSESLPKLINSSPALIWKYQDSEEYYVKEINASTLKHLLHEIAEGKPVESSNSADPDCFVWIVSGNGEVYSPYLKPSAGNVGYGKLFEYDPELIPNEAFVSAVGSLLD